MSYRKRRIGHGDGRGHDPLEYLTKICQNFGKILAIRSNVANFAKILPKFWQTVSLYIETHKTVSFEQADGSFEAEAADAPTGVARRGREQGAEQKRARLSRGPPARASSKEVRAQAF
jgi:hypothetical protein